MSEDNQNKNYEFESADEVPDYMEGYIDKNLIKKEDPKNEKKKSLIARFFGALLNILTLGFYGRAKRKQKLDQEFENANELGLNDEQNVIGSSINSLNEEKEREKIITKEEADAAQKGTDFDNSSTTDKIEDVKETETNLEQNEM